MRRETWLPVLRFPEYEVSDRGRVRRATGGMGTRAGRVLRPSRNPSGYLIVDLCVGARRTKAYVHDLVLEAFVGPRPHGFECDHEDFDRGNNRLRNLEWVTPAENKRRAHAAGRIGRKIRVPEATVTAIRSAIALGEETGRQIAARFDVHPSYVSMIRSGKRRTIPA